MKVKSVKYRRMAARLDKDHSTYLENVKSLGLVLTRFRYEGKPALGRNAKRAHDVLNAWEGGLTRHMRLEENVVFPYLTRRMPKLQSAVSVLRSEHSDLRQSLRYFERLVRSLVRDGGDDANVRVLLNEMIDTGAYLKHLASHHIRAERRLWRRVSLGAFRRHGRL